MNIAKGIKLSTYIEISEEVVKTRAYYNWEESGRPDNRSEEFYYTALDQIFEETEELILQDSPKSEVEGIDLSFEIATEADSNWSNDIEEAMPEIKHMRFNNINQKISWMFNNLKRFKNGKKIEESTPNLLCSELSSLIHPESASCCVSAPDPVDGGYIVHPAVEPEVIKTITETEAEVIIQVIKPIENVEVTLVADEFKEQQSADMGTLQKPFEHIQVECPAESAPMHQDTVAEVKNDGQSGYQQAMEYLKNKEEHKNELPCSKLTTDQTHEMYHTDKLALQSS